MKPWWKADARLSRSMRRTCYSRIFGCERLPLAASESKSSSGMVLKGSRKGGGKLVVAEFAATVFRPSPESSARKKEL